MPRKPPYFFQPNEKKAFLKACEDNSRNHAIFKTLFDSGLRISELVGDKRTVYRGLYVEDIDFENRQFRVFGKGKKERMVVVSKQAIESRSEGQISMPLGCYRSMNSTTAEASSLRIFQGVDA